MIRSRSLLPLGGALALVFATSLSPALRANTGPSYTIFIDTNDGANSIKGSQGYLQLAFIPGSIGDSLAGTADITNFSVPNGSYDPFDVNNLETGSVSGNLATGLEISNTDPVNPNSLLQFITFGDDISFDVSFSGDAFDPTQLSSFGSLFSASLFDTSAGVLLSTNQSGDIVDVNVDPNDDVSTTTFPAGDGTSEATITEDRDVSAVPEPSSAVTTSIGLLSLGLLAFAARRKQKA